MTAHDFLHELTLPLRSTPILLTAALYLIAAGVVVAIHIVNPLIALGLGTILTVVLLPALPRYLVRIAERRAAGQDVEPPDAEMFALLGSLRPLSTLLIPIAAAAIWAWFDARLGSVASGAWLVLVAAAYPAMIGVLLITGSVVQAANPAAIATLIARAGSGYWFAPATALAALGVPAILRTQSQVLAAIAFLFLLFALFAVSGGVLARRRLIEDVRLPDPVVPDSETRSAGLSRQRTVVLNHAYGFFSRDNRRGALAHLEDWLARDPDPVDARRWFFERMLAWELKEPALYFAQACITHLLSAGEDIAAVKLLLRCRLVNERFRPLPGDLERAVEAARATGNAELAKSLSRFRGL